MANISGTGVDFVRNFTDEIDPFYFYQVSYIVHSLLSLVPRFLSSWRFVLSALRACGTGGTATQGRRTVPDLKVRVFRV